MRALAAALSFTLLAGCPPPHVERSLHYDQDRILQEYLIEYDGEADETTASAAFFFVPEDPAEPEQRLALSKPSYIKHNGKALGFDQWDGDYPRTLKGFVAVHDWEWRNGERVVYRNALTVFPIALVDPPAILSASSPVALAFEPPLADGEQVILYLSHAPSWDFLPIAEAADAGATLAGPGSLWDFVLGQKVGKTIGLVLVRSSGGALAEVTSAGGSYKAISRSEPVLVEVDP